MVRLLHLVLGRLAGLFLVVLAGTGVVLAIDAVIESAARPAAMPSGLSVADLAGRVASGGALERLVVMPSGTVLAQFASPRRRVEIDPATWATRPARDPVSITPTATEIHRTLGLGDGGRLVLALATLAGLAVAGTGLVRAVRRERDPGGLARLHRAVGLVLVLPFALSAVTGLCLAVAAFRPLDLDGVHPPFPSVLAEGSQRPVGEITALRAVPAEDLEELLLPRRGDPDDAYLLTTVDAFAWIDPVSGLVAAHRDRPSLHRLVRSLSSLHGGRGHPAIAIVLGLAGAALPVVALSGLTLGRRRRRIGDPVSAGADLLDADTVVLVGSEGGTTLGFAERLARTLRDSGHRVHLAAIDDLARDYPRTERLLVVTSTHGVGDPPSNASRFATRLARLARVPPFAVVGFGERDAARFCGFAVTVDAALTARGGRALLPLRRIHRRSEPDFEAWVADLLAVIDATPAPLPPHVPLPSRAERRLSGPAMGSRWTATLVVPADLDVTPLAGDLARRVGRIEAEMTRFRAGSALLAFDTAPIDRWIDISEDLATVVACGLDIGRRSGGAFDIGLAAEVAAHGFGEGWVATGGGPRRDRRPAFEALELDRPGRRLRKRAPIALDLAGIAKGYAVDELARVIEDAGIAAFLVGLDGELRAGAGHADGRPWAVGLEAPVVGRRETVGHIDLVERAVATSGDYRRFGPRGGHTIDPATGAPVGGGPASVSVLAATCIAADAWATALMVTGRAGLAAARAANVEAIFIDDPAGGAAPSAPVPTPVPIGETASGEGGCRPA